MEFEKLQADFAADPIEGWLHTGERLSVPLISHIVDNLYVGGYGIDGRRPVHLQDFFSHIFSLYKWKKYRTTKDTITKSWTMYDSSDGLDVDTIEEASDAVVRALQAGGNVLVHCQAGINRSNLVAAVALRKWKGLTSREAIDMLREKRTRLVLANKTFEEYLLSLDD